MLRRAGRDGGSVSTVVGAGFVAELLPKQLIADAVAAGPLWRAFGNRILTRAKDLCPGTGPLRNSLGVKYRLGLDPAILIGSALQTESGVSLLGLNLLGTDPHSIDGNPVLAFLWPKMGEGTFFFAHVNHPGTKPNPFIQKAMREVVHDVGGVVAV